jgi:hypothetical protein
MRFAIIGKARAGKTTFAEYLANHMGLTASNTSDWLVEVEQMRRKRLGTLVPNCQDAAPFTKSEHRSWLIALGDAVCAQRPGFLIDQALLRGSVITGIRRKEEFEHLPKDVITVFIDRDDAIADNFDIPKSKAKYVINNNGSLEDLAASAIEVANACLGKAAESIKRRG